MLGSRIWSSNSPISPNRQLVSFAIAVRQEDCRVRGVDDRRLHLRGELAERRPRGVATILDWFGSADLEFCGDRSLTERARSPALKSASTDHTRRPSPLCKTRISRCRCATGCFWTTPRPRRAQKRGICRRPRAYSVFLPAVLQEEPSACRYLDHCRLCHFQSATVDQSAIKMYHTT